MELDGVVGEALQAPRGIIPGCALLVGPLRVSARVVVDDLSLQRFDDHNRVAHELERASTCMAANFMQAGCEIATKKSKVLSNSISVAGTAAAAWRAGDADRTDGRGWRSPKDQESPRQILGAMAATAGADCACMHQCQKQTITVWRSLGSMERSCSSPRRRWRLAWRRGCMARAQQ